MSEDEKEKWSCEFCTYLNWPSAVKCTLCRARRRSELITAPVTTSPSPDIYQLAGLGNQSPSITRTRPEPTDHVSDTDKGNLSSTSATNVGSPVPQQPQHVKKWSCFVCTYLNWPRSKKCIQCMTPRGRRSPSISQQQTESPSESVVITESGPITMPSSAVVAQVSIANMATEIGKDNEEFETETDGKIGGQWDMDQSQVGDGDPNPPCFRSDRPATSDAVSLPPTGLGTIERSQEMPLSKSASPRLAGSSFDTGTCEVGTTSPEPNVPHPTTCQDPPASDTKELSLSPVPSTGFITQQQRTESGKASPVIKSALRSPNSPDCNQGPSSSATLDSRLIAKKLQKWTCVACTYENWPKAPRCVMCYSPRPTAGTSDTLGSICGTNKPALSNKSSHGSPTGSDHEGNDKKRAATGIDGGGVYSKSPKNSSSESINNQDHTIGAGINRPHGFEVEDRLLRSRLRDIDWLWLQACKAVLSLDPDPVEAYIAAGGEATRVLTANEVNYLTKHCGGQHFEAGHTLIHLAVRHHREDLLTLLLACTGDHLQQQQPHNPLAGPTTSHHQPRRVKKVPSHVSPEIASTIRRHVAMSLRQRKGEFPCYFFTDVTTFCLPAKIYDLPLAIQDRLFEELLDRDVQKELEEETPIINWSLELTDRLNSRLYALWNRTAGDCLLDSVLQATWGVFDSENSLRQALADSLNDAANGFYPRWKEYESITANALHFSLDEDQWTRDWDLVLQMASKPGSALEQAHIFALAHIVRRPIIVYGIRLVKSFRGETIGIAPFEGLYLPLLWEPSFCWRSPIVLGYTRGHFTALVPMEPDLCESGASASVRDHTSMQPRYVYLPLTDADEKLLPIHFLSMNEYGHEQAILRSWMDCCVTDGGLLVCKMKLHRFAPMVQQLMDDWIDYYQHLGHSSPPAAQTQPTPDAWIAAAAQQQQQPFPQLQVQQQPHPLHHQTAQTNAINQQYIQQPHQYQRNNRRQQQQRDTGFAISQQQQILQQQIGSTTKRSSSFRTMGPVPMITPMGIAIGTSRNSPPQLTNRPPSRNARTVSPLQPKSQHPTPDISATEQALNSPRQHTTTNKIATTTAAADQTRMTSVKPSLSSSSVRESISDTVPLKTTAGGPLKSLKRSSTAVEGVGRGVACPIDGGVAGSGCEGNSPGDQEDGDDDAGDKEASDDNDDPEL